MITQATYSCPIVRVWGSVQGFLGVAVGGVVLFFCVFQLGKFVMAPLQRIKLKYS